MSVELYINKASEGIKNKVKENLDFIKNNPFPKEELKTAISTAGKDSVLSKIYTVDGKTDAFVSSTPEDLMAAKEQAELYPGLWNRLANGQRSLIRIERNRELEAIDPEIDLSTGFAKFMTALYKAIGSGIEIKIDELFSDKTDSATFADYLNEFNIDLNSYGADSLIKSAFTELFTRRLARSAGSPAVNTASESIENREISKPSINSTESSTIKTASVSSTPINPATIKSSEPTSVTSSEGAVTSKVGEIQAENILEPNSSQAININLETKPATILNTESLTSLTSAGPVSSVVNNPTNSTNILESATNNTTTGGTVNSQSSSNTVNEAKKEKTKESFLSKVGGIVKSVGSVLNLPSVSEIGEQAKGLIGSTGSNISSKISKVKESLAINSNETRSESLKESSTNNSVNNSSSTNRVSPESPYSPSAESTSNTSNTLIKETTSEMNVEKKSPNMTAVTSSPIDNTQNVSTNTSSNILSSANSQNSNSPQTVTSTVSKNTQTVAQPPAPSPGPNINIDMNQLAQSISRLERILISGIEVTIKDT